MKFLKLLNRHRSNSEVFMNIEQFKKMCRINIYGHAVYNTSNCWVFHCAPSSLNYYKIKVLYFINLKLLSREMEFTGKYSGRRTKHDYKQLGKLKHLFNHYRFSDR